MSYLSRFFSRLSLRILLWGTVTGVLIIIFWFSAPYLGFGEVRPLTGIAARLIVALFMVFLMVALLARWSWIMILLAAGCAIIWVHGRWVKVGQQYLLAGVSQRLIVIGLLLAGYLFYLWFVRFRRLAAAGNHRDSSSSGESEVALAEAELLLRHILRRVRQRPDKQSLWQRWFGITSPAESVPWYLLLGASQSGKTAAICQSGHHFSPDDPSSPVARADHQQDFSYRMANDAVYIEAAGRFINDPHSSSTWRPLVQLLKKYRPSQTVQGVMVVVSALDLLVRDREQINDFATVFRTRLRELRQITGVDFPVYVVITHLDHLQGFTEYFRHLSDAERQKIWGVTFPVDSEVTLLVDYVHQQLSELVQRIDRDLLRRLQNEYDLQNRRKMHGFPEDLQRLCLRLGSFIRTVFFYSRYEGSEQAPAFRGVYLTSSTQPGGKGWDSPDTLIQSWRNCTGLSDTTELPQGHPPEGPVSAATSLPGQSGFLQQLFCELTLNDRHLARDTRITLSGLWMKRWPLQLLLILAASVSLSAIAISYVNNSEYLQQMTRKVEVTGEQQQALTEDSSPARLDNLLSSLQHLPQSALVDIADAGWGWRYGYFTGNTVSSAAAMVYQSALRQLLLPVAEQRVTTALELAVRQRDPQLIYARLRLYLMVYRLIPAEATDLADEISKVLVPAGITPVPVQSPVFYDHLYALFSHPDASYPVTPPDKSLLQQAQQLLEQQSQTARLYQRVKQRLSEKIPPAPGITAMTDSQDGPWFELNRSAEVKTINGLFTYRGYQHVQKEMWLMLKPLVDEDQLIMSAGLSQATNVFSGGLITLYRELFIRYLDEYAGQWQQFMDNLRVVMPLNSGKTPDLAGQQRDLYRLSRLGAADSPLVKLLQRLVAETTLLRSALPAADELVASGRVPAALKAAGKQWLAEEQTLIWQHMDRHFSQLRQFVNGTSQGGAGKGSVDGSTALSLLTGQLHQLNILLRLSQDPLVADTPRSWAEQAAALRADAHNWPVPVNNILLPLLDKIAGRIRHSSVGDNYTAIRQGPAEFCRRTLAGNYPFSHGRREVSIADFVRFFAPGGIADNYFQQYLADKVNTSTVPWTFKHAESGDKRNQILQLFYRAGEIRRIFFAPHSGNQLSLPVTISVPYMSPSLTRLKLGIGETQLIYSHGPLRPLSVHWPGSTAEAPVSLLLTEEMSGDVMAEHWSGPWSLFRWIDSAQQRHVQPSGALVIDFPRDDKKVTFSLSGVVSGHQPVTEILRSFKCG